MLPGPLRGKGIWIRRIADCEGGDLEAITARALAANYSHILIKIADGADPYNVQATTQFDDAGELTRRLSGAGIAVWGWHSLYGERPRFKSAPRGEYHQREAECAVTRVAQLRPLGLQGYVVDALGDYEYLHDRARLAAQFMDLVREGLADLPVALSAWRLPHTHRRFPWSEFRRRCDLDMPQVYWSGRQENIARHLSSSVRQFQELIPRLPYVAAGSPLVERDRMPTADEIVTFFQATMDLGLPAANLSAWDMFGWTGDEPTGNPLHLDFRLHWMAAAEIVWISAPTRLPEPEPAEAPPTWIPERAEGQAISEPHLDLEPEGELPEWLQFLTEPVPAPALDLEADISYGIALGLEVEDELPEWLHFLNEPPVPPGPVAAAVPTLELEADVSDEIGLGLEPEGELPEWLHFLHESDIETEPVAAGATDAAPQTPSAAYGTPAIIEVAPPTEPPPGPEPGEAVVSEQPVLEPLAEAWTSPPSEPEPVPTMPQEPTPEPQLEETLVPQQHVPELVPFRLDQLTPETEFTTDVEEALAPQQHIPELVPFSFDQLAPHTEFTADVEEALAPQQRVPELVPFSFGPLAPEADLTADVEFEFAAAAQAVPLPPYESPVVSPDAAAAPEGSLLPQQHLQAPLRDASEPQPPTAEAVAIPGLESEPAPQITLPSEPEWGAPPTSVPEVAEEPEMASEVDLIAPQTATEPAGTAVVSPGSAVGRFFEALRRDRPEEAASVYGPGFAHVNSDRVAHSHEVIRQFYESMLAHLKADELVWLVLRGGARTCTVQWMARTRDGAPLKGTDLFHLNREGQIVYHDTSFRISME